MRIFTLIRQALDAEESVRVEQSGVALGASKLVMDTMDEYGVEEALRLRERGAGAGTEIVAVAVGPARLQDALRTALALGADRAIHVETEVALDAVGLSVVVAALAREEAVDLILSGGQQADWDSHALGAAVAERLDWPQVTWTSALTLEGASLSGTHDVDEGSESFMVDLPAVVTTQQGLNEPRYPTLPGIMKAKKKEMRKETMERFGCGASVVFDGAAIQVKTRLNRILDGKDVAGSAAELVGLLRHEARVIA